VITTVEMGCSGSKDGSSKSSTSRASSSTQQQWTPESQKAARRLPYEEGPFPSSHPFSGSPRSSTRSSPEKPKRPTLLPRTKRVEASSSNLRNQSQTTSDPHAIGCQCRQCAPQLYHHEVTPKQLWDDEHTKDCRCHVCTSKPCPHGGHRVPETQQCKRRWCPCKKGCKDRKCIMCNSWTKLKIATRPSLEEKSSRPPQGKKVSPPSAAKYITPPSIERNSPLVHDCENNEHW
jgi:hypothetical protein